METIFNKIINKEIPSYEVYNDDSFYAFLDINPINPGHTLVIPKKGQECLLKESDEVISTLMVKGKEIAQDIMSKLNADGIKFVFNNGAEAGQEVMHTHLHIIPYYKEESTLTIEEVHELLKK